MGRSGSTCAVAICSSPRNVMYHRFPHANGIAEWLSGIEIENQAKSQTPETTCETYIYTFTFTKRHNHG